MDDDNFDVDQHGGVDARLLEAEKVASELNEQARQKAEKKKADLRKKKQRRKAVTLEEQAERAAQLNGLLEQCAAFANVISEQSDAAIGKNGSAPKGAASDGITLGQHNLVMAEQPKIMTGGEMRDYQLEGLTWMMEICSQALSGILADEMGLGKTIQTISLIARTREGEMTKGPHLIVAPLSTLQNWINEFQKWAPSIPVLLFHGNPEERAELFKTQVEANLKKDGPNDDFPVVCTSYEMILRERNNLSRIDWEFLIIDEGHRMKNLDSRLFQELETFKSVTRFLITGTPLQNNLKELFSLLHFLLPTLFSSWTTFETWFDFDLDVLDDEGTAEFIADKNKHVLVSKIHRVLRPLLLRRLKADVAAHLPKKREYILYAPLTQEQQELYHAINDKEVDTRALLENKVVEHLTGATNTPAMSRAQTPSATRSSSIAPKAASAKGKQKDRSVTMPIRASPRKHAENAASSATNAFAKMMPGKRAASLGTDALNPITPPPRPVGRGTKRKETPSSEMLVAKSAKSSRHSTPATSTPAVSPPIDETPTRRMSRRPKKGKAVYREADADKEDRMSDVAFERKLRKELDQEEARRTEEPELSPEEAKRVATLDLAKRQMKHKKLGNPLMQLRLVCNSPHNFYSPWSYDGNIDVDESIVNASGKLLLLDRLLPAAFKKGHKVLIFSQFKTQLEVLHDYATLRKWEVCRIDGSTPQAERQQQIDYFNTNKKAKLFILSTRAGGQGINLAAADTVILYDSDWNPQQDLQAQDRAHRIGQKNPVVVFRLATKGTVEEELLMSAEGKRRLEKLVIKKGGFYDIVNEKRGAHSQALDSETLKHMLLKDGQVYQASDDREILTDDDLDKLLDRSDHAYERAAAGQGDADGFRVVETTGDGLQLASDIAASQATPAASQTHAAQNP